MVQARAIELVGAETGREAGALYPSCAADLVCVDLSMPEMDGKEATRAIRAMEAGSGRRVPIVALTAHAMTGDDTDILAAGLDHYLTKPLRKDVIVAHIQDACPPGARPPQP
jgi:CheY-like chemotaxis protein